MKSKILMVHCMKKLKCVQYFKILAKHFSGSLVYSNGHQFTQYFSSAALRTLIILRYDYVDVAKV